MSAAYVVSLLVLLFQPCLLRAQETTKQDVWKPFRYFVGPWTGDETGKSGTGRGEREYEFILDGRYLHFKNESVFKPQEKNPEGETHRDWTFFSYDEQRSTFVMREFHSEGFVNQYTLDSISADGKLMMFVTESIENVPAGLRARVTYAIQDQDTFVETFELGGPGKLLSPMLKNTWRRRTE